MSQVKTKFIADNAVTNAKLAQMTAHTYKGNNTGSTANAIDVTSTQLTADLNLFSNSLQGLTPSSGGGTANFLRADGTWTAPPGTGANTSLSNLITTAINQSLLPTSANTLNIGSAALYWANMYSGFLFGPAGTGRIDMSNYYLIDVSNVKSLDWKNRELFDTSGVLQGTWGTTGLELKTALLLDGSSSGAITQKASATTTSYSITWPAAQASGTQVLQNNGSGVLSWATASAGSVSSVAFADNSTTPIYNVSGTPVTSSGTLAITLATQSANNVFAGPTTGSAAQPTFRSLVAADIPSLSATYVTQAEVGAANGVAGLDSGGKVPLSQLPSALMEFQGNWNPSTNSPMLVDGTGTTGFTYWVSVAFAGPVSGLNDPSMVNFQVGDLVIYNGTAWVLTTPAAGVQSVNGAQGAVTVNAINQLTGDVTASAASGSQSKATSLVATSNATLTTLSALTTASALATVGTITSGTWNATTIAIAHGGTGQTSAASAFAALSPLTTAGDIIYENATPAPARLGIGSTGQVLTVSGGLPVWSTPATAPTLTSLGIFSGKTSISSGVTSQAVTFSTAFGSTGYSITANLLNTTDANPQFQPITITAQSSGGFTASWNVQTPTANYVLSWQAILNN